MQASVVTIVLVLLLLTTTACNDDPFEIRWDLQADTVLLYSLARPEMNMDSGFNFRPGTLGPVRIEAATATGTWDIALDTRGGELVLLPPSALGVSSAARLAAIPGKRREEVVEAPAEGAEGDSGALPSADKLYDLAVSFRAPEELGGAAQTVHLLYADDATLDFVHVATMTLSHVVCCTSAIYYATIPPTPLGARLIIMLLVFKLAQARQSNAMHLHGLYLERRAKRKV